MMSIEITRDHGANKLHSNSLRFKDYVETHHDEFLDYHQGNSSGGSIYVYDICLFEVMETIAIWFADNQNESVGYFIG